MQKKLAIGALLAAYLASAAAALRNPLNIPDDHVSLSLQGATVASLGIMLPLLGQQRVVAALFYVSLASLVSRILYGGVFDTSLAWVMRWDSLAMLGGLLATTAVAAYDLGGSPLALLLLLLGIPVLTALPRASSATRTHADLLRTALDVSGKAYAIRRDDNTEEAEYIQDTPTGTMAGVTSYGDSGDTYVFFAGTQSWTDWVRVNGDVALTDVPANWGIPGKPKVHRGFLRGYLAIRAKLWNLLQDFILRTAGAKRIIVCGHSLGGALATLAALDIATRLDPEDAKKVACVTFGAPQIGDKTLVQAFDAIVPLSLRVAAIYDPIPKALSTQLPHVKGYVPIASPPIMPIAHTLEAYRFGIRQQPVTNALVMAAPMLFIIVFAFLFSEIAPRLR